MSYYTESYRFDFTKDSDEIFNLCVELECEPWELKHLESPKAFADYLRRVHWLEEYADDIASEECEYIDYVIEYNCKIGCYDATEKLVTSNGTEYLIASHTYLQYKSNPERIDYIDYEMAELPIYTKCLEDDEVTYDFMHADEYEPATFIDGVFVGAHKKDIHKNE